MNKNTDNKPNFKALLRQKYSEEGFEALSEQEKIHMLLSYSAGKHSDELADFLIERYSSLTAVLDADPHYLMKNASLDKKTVVLLKLIPELSRLYFIENKNIKSLSSASIAIKFFENFFIGAFQEQLVAVCTDNSFNIIKSQIISKGSVSSVNTSCREIADFALRNNSSRIFIAHNHPAGSAVPSACDFNATNIIFDSLKRLDITLIDHIIVSKESAVSMRKLPYTLPFKNEDCFGYIIS